MSQKPSTEAPLPSFEELREAVYEIVAQIPKGKVLTYGAIALAVWWDVSCVTLPMGNCPATAW